jgi:hypothetical protein
LGRRDRVPIQGADRKLVAPTLPVFLPTAVVLLTVITALAAMFELISGATDELIVGTRDPKLMLGERIRLCA